MYFNFLPNGLFLIIGNVSIGCCRDGRFNNIHWTRFVSSRLIDRSMMPMLLLTGIINCVYILFQNTHDELTTTYSSSVGYVPMSKLKSSIQMLRHELVERSAQRCR